MKYVRYAVASLAVTSVWPLAAQTVAPESTTEETITLSEFQVNTAADKGYRAANSVSATRVAVAIKDLPMNVSAFTQDFINDQKANDLLDVVKYAGVRQDNVSQSGWARYNIRGFTNTAIQRDGFGSFRFIDVSNIERVEVVKGPSSLLYGQINPGGVINYISKKPKEQQSTEITASVGNDGYWRTQIDSTGPVPGTDGKLLFRGVYTYENLLEYTDFMEGYKKMFAPSLTWKPFENVSLTVGYEKFIRSENMPPTSLALMYVDGNGTYPYPLPRNFNWGGYGDFQDFTSEVLNTELIVKFTDWLQMRAQWAYSSYQHDWRATGQGGTGLLTQAAIDAFYPAGTLTPEHAMFRRNRAEVQSGDESIGQVELTGKFELGGITFRPLIGYREQFKGHFHGWQANNNTLKPWDLRDPSTWDREVPFGYDALTVTSDRTTDTESMSYYGVLNASAFNDRLNVLAGWSHYELDNLTGVNLLTGALTAPTSREANVPQYGASFRITNELSAFVSYSESFLANSSLLQVKSIPTTPAEPSIGEGKEVGFKVDLFNGRLSGTVSVFDTTVSPTGVITITDGTDPVTGNTLFTDIQGGEQKSEGYEIELLFNVTEGLQLFSSFVDANATYSEHPSNPAFTGTRLVGTPDRTFDIWTKYTFQNGPLKDFYVGGGYSFTGKTGFQANRPDVVMPAYETFDATMGYRLRNVLGRTWDLDLTVKNLTDEYYIASASSYGLPRQIYFTVKTRF